MWALSSPCPLSVPHPGGQQEDAAHATAEPKARSGWTANSASLVHPTPLKGAGRRSRLYSVSNAIQRGMQHRKPASPKASALGANIEEDCGSANHRTSRDSANPNRPTTTHTRHSCYADIHPHAPQGKPHGLSRKTPAKHCLA